MDPSVLAETTREAEELMAEEDDFPATVPRKTDPRRLAAADPGSIYNRAMNLISTEDLEVLKLRFPRLKEFSDSFLRGRSMEELLKIESTSLKIRDAERRGEAEDRLANNKQNLEASAVFVEGSRDDRCGTLHKGRFLAGAACSSKKFWLAARAAIDVTGHEPVANYDLSSVGMGGFVTSKGWIELANPGSTKMALKLFNINNVGNKLPGSRTSAEPVQGDDDIAELGEFKLALRTLRTAAQFVCPWNLSFLALENFLVQSEFCMTELSGTENPAGTLTQFVDYILHENANRWRDSEPFLQTPELKTAWFSFSSARPRVLLKKKEVSGSMSQVTTARKQTPKLPKGQASGFGGLPSNHPRLNMPFTDACKAYNVGKCSKQAGTCTTKKGTPLRHTCNWSDLSVHNAVVCGQPHPAYLNH
jgi:hypothetical protein